MRSDASLFDVLVIGSGASGLAAAVAADGAGARVALATKTTLQACNSAKAQGGIQAAFGDDDSPRSTPRTSCAARTTQQIPDSSRCSRARRRRRSTGSRSSASSSRARTAVTASLRARAASGCSRSATARGTRSRRRFGRRTRPAPGRAPSPRSHCVGAGRLRLESVVPDEGGHRRDRRRRHRARGRWALLRGGRGARRPPRTIRMRPARRLASPSRPARRRGTSMRSSTTRTEAPGRRRCRATRSRRRRAPTAPRS